LSSASDLAAGSEILILDSDANVRVGLEKLLGEVGLVVTSVGDVGDAGRLLSEKFFAVVVVDLDTPSPGAGLALVSEVKERSPASAVIVLAARKVFESAVRAFRGGAADIVAKAPDQVEYVRHRVIELAAESRVDLDRRKLLGEAHEVHEQFLQRMMETARKVVDLEERISGRSPSSNSGSDTLTTFVLIAATSSELYDSLRAGLPTEQGFHFRSVTTGGEALDVASGQTVHIALVEETLPDLPGSMVVRTLVKTSPATLAVTYGADGAARLFDGPREITIELGRGAQAVERVLELREGVRAKNRERRYLQAFKAQHYEFLRRYAELKQKMEKILQR
jgi:DNA-binding NtrC family response regulator